MRDRRPFAELVLSAHAHRRCQQRGISEEVLKILYEHGRTAWCRDGVLSYTINRNQHSKLRVAIGEPAFRSVVDHLDSYMVVSLDGTIVTVAHRVEKHRAA